MKRSIQGGAGTAAIPFLLPLRVSAPALFPEGKSKRHAYAKTTYTAFAKHFMGDNRESVTKHMCFGHTFARMLAPECSGISGFFLSTILRDCGVLPGSAFTPKARGMTLQTICRKLIMYSTTADAHINRVIHWPDSKPHGDCCGLELYQQSISRCRRR
ncbi:MAG TPA: hypothetical protein VGH19_23720 [Verrucomicrobiae bacterium]